MIPTLLTATIAFIIAFVALHLLTLMEFVNQSLAPCSMETILSQAQSYPAATLLACTSTQFGKQPPR